METLLIALGSSAIYLVGVLSVGTMWYRQTDWERYTPEGERAAWSAFAGLSWPVIAGVAILASPFIGLAAFVSRKTPEQRRQAFDSNQAQLERELGIGQSMEPIHVPESAYWEPTTDPRYRRHSPYNPDGSVRRP